MAHSPTFFSNNIPQYLSLRLEETGFLFCIAFVEQLEDNNWSVVCAAYNYTLSAHGHDEMFRRKKKNSDW